MFREMRRMKQALTKEECIRVLKEAKRGVLSVNGDDGYPYAVTINYFYDETENLIWFHGSKAGHKNDAMRKDPRVCFTVIDNGRKKEGHWEWNVNSVVCFGKAEFVSDREIAERMLRKVAERYFPTEEEIDAAVEKSMDRAQIFCVQIEHMTGKNVNEK